MPNKKKIDGGESEPWWFNELSTISDLPLLNAVPLIGGVAGFINSFFLVMMLLPNH